MRSVLALFVAVLVTFVPFALEVRAGDQHTEDPSPSAYGHGQDLVSVLGCEKDEHIMSVIYEYDETEGNSLLSARALRNRLHTESVPMRIISAMQPSNRADAQDNRPILFEYQSETGKMRANALVMPLPSEGWVVDSFAICMNSMEE